VFCPFKAAATWKNATLVQARRTDAELLAEHRSFRIRILANARPHIVLAREPVAAVVDIPKPASRIDPQGRVEGARAVARRQGDRFGRREGFPAIVAVGEHAGIFGFGFFRSAGEPREKHTAFRRALHAGYALPSALAEINGNRLGGM
jgi:hypothetical protein